MHPHEHIVADASRAAERGIGRKYGIVAGRGIVTKRCVVIQEREAADFRGVAHDRKRAENRAGADRRRRGDDGSRMDEREKLGSARLERFSNHPAGFWNADRQNESVARLGLEAARVGQNWQRAGLAIGSAGVVGEEASDEAALRGPGGAGPEEHFPTKSPGAHDENAANATLSRRLLREGSR